MIFRDKLFFFLLFSIPSISFSEELVVKKNASLFQVVLVLIFVILIFLFYKIETLCKFTLFKLEINVPPFILFSFFIVLTFATLVYLGLTGSSMELGIKKSPLITAEIINIWGKDKQIRSDEWALHTPYSISQYNHTPKFPIVNLNIGEDGQNMLIVGMFGTPVSHLSTIAKPATWGFFFLDLKRALSWMWFFPIFGCLISFWGVMSILIPGKWRENFLISLWFILSPYITAWSNWPAYPIFFSCLVFLGIVGILRSKNKCITLTLGLITGIASAGFILVLYTPWLVTLGYVFFVLLVGVSFRDKLFKNINFIKLTALLLAFFFAGSILYLWWSDAQHAISALINTEYPGQRNTVTGGTRSISDLLRGFTNIVSMRKLEPGWSNQSEIASFYYLFLPVVFIFINRAKHKLIGATKIALMALAFFILYFMMVGISPEFAKLSLWGYVPANRADIGLGLIYTILCGLLLVPKNDKVDLTTSFISKLYAVATSALWAAIVLSSIYASDTSIRSLIRWETYLVILIFTFISGYWLALGNFKNFIYVNLALSAATVITFNPLNIAPNLLTLNSPIISNEIRKNQALNQDSPRILVLEGWVWAGGITMAQYLLASGLPVVNGTQFYPQKKIWDKLDPHHKSVKVYNRFQSLLFLGSTTDEINEYKIESTSPDTVIVKINLEKFDFEKSGANIILAPTFMKNQLDKNKKIHFIANEFGWSIFKVPTGNVGL